MQPRIGQLGLRFDAASASFTYSSDTSPSDSIAELARRSDVLLHESTFLGGREELAGRIGHSTARQAGEVAAAARVERLILVHFTPAGPEDLTTLKQDAEAIFPGPIGVPSDYESMVLG